VAILLGPGLPKEDIPKSDWHNMGDPPSIKRKIFMILTSLSTACITRPEPGSATITALLLTSACTSSSLQQTWRPGKARYSWLNRKMTSFPNPPGQPCAGSIRGRRSIALGMGPGTLPWRFVKKNQEICWMIPSKFTICIIVTTMSKYLIDRTKRADNGLQLTRSASLRTQLNPTIGSLM